MRNCSRFFKNTFSLTMVFALTLTVYCQNGQVDAKKVNKKVKKPWQQVTQKLINDMPKDQQEKLKRLQRENPEAFRKEIHNLARRHKAKQVKSAQKKEMEELVSKYHNAKGDEKEKLLSVIREKVSKQFHDKMANSRANIEKTETRLGELKTLLKTREENADKIIQERIEYLTKDPSLKW